MPTKRHKRRLNDRDNEILRFIARYRIGTSTLLRESCFERGATLKNVDRVLRRLIKRGLIKRTELNEGHAYYTMTRRGLGLVTDEPRTPHPLTEQTLPKSLAIAFYCVRNDLTRLTKDEFVENHPELSRPGKGNNNYVLVPVDGAIKLELLMVDRGGAAHRVRSHVRRLISQRRDLPHFLALMQAGKFRITVLTSTPEQRGKILRRTDSQFSPIEVTAYVVPELADLLMIRKK